MGNTGSPTFLERVKIQAEVLVPLVKAFEAGTEHARTVVRAALQDWVRRTYARIREDAPGNPIDLASSRLPTFAEGALEYEVVHRSAEAFDFDVTKCRCAEFCL